MMMLHKIPYGKDKTPDSYWPEPLVPRPLAPEDKKSAKTKNAEEEYHSYE